MKQTPTAFPIPATLQDLERSPYNLLPYPVDFVDDDETTRAESFEELVHGIEHGNSLLENGGYFQREDEEDWMTEERVQSLYTLVRKSSSLAAGTREMLVAALCESVQILSCILSNTGSRQESPPKQEDSQSFQPVMSQSFRDAYSCHLYMLYSVMLITESEEKIARGLNEKSGSALKTTKSITSRALCAKTMLEATQTMSTKRSILWLRGVPDEATAILPCRIAYQMMESATGVLARKAASADEALGMIAATVDSAENLLGTVVASLVDLLHSYEHMAPLIADLCCMCKKNTSNLTVEILREIGRIDTPVLERDGGKASGVKNVAPFVSEIASRRPLLVLSNISVLLPHLDSEPYSLRSAVVTSIGHILHGLNQERDVENDSTVENDSQPVGTDLTKSRDALFDVLIERVHDVSSFTRSAVIKALISLAEKRSIPLERVYPVAFVAIDRLQDKTVMVRRNAMHLLTVLLEFSPFVGYLDPAPYKKKAFELRRFILSNLPLTLREAFKSSIDDAGEQLGEATKRELEDAAVTAAVMEGEQLDENEELSDADVAFKSKTKAYKFALSAIDFIDLFEKAQHTFQSMLLSSTTSDVTEALRFFVRARHFKLPFAVTGMRNALALMWSSERSIRDEVLKAFVDVFIAVPGTDGGELLPDEKIAHNLLVLTGRASVSELASIEEALGTVVKDEGIPARVFLILWSIAAKASGDARAAAMLVLSMAASADKTIVDSASRLKLLLEAGLGDYTEEHRDWRTARSAACALQRLVQVNGEGASAKHIVLEQIIERLCAVAEGAWCLDHSTSDTKQWFSAAEQAIDALFTICPAPEIASTEIIRHMEANTFCMADGERIHSLRLARFFFVLGHIALKLLVYTESLSSSVRRANASKALKKQEAADKMKRSSANEDDSAIEAELGVAAEVEAENERKLADISEKEIVGRGLIGVFGPLLVRVVDNEGGQFGNELLMQSATLALCKLMCISSSFCEKYLPLLFTSLKKAPSEDTTLRANTVVALGDLAFRFPNEVEPYTPRLYACLRDRSGKVRRHTLMVLTHLILNDMVKVKGQVCEIAMCLQDDDCRIRDMSRLLFHELSKRSNNPVYNLLPDIISQLSQMSVGQESFRSIMSFLLAFIKRDKQNEMLIEKLCHRIPKCTSISQKSDIVFCMAQLKVNERSIKCLNDQFKLYKDALFHEDVKKSFFSILTKAKKSLKPEMKEYLEEWEEKLTENAETGRENELAGQKAAREKKKASRRAVRKRPKTTPSVGEENLVVFSDLSNQGTGPMEPEVG